MDRDITEGVLALHEQSDWRMNVFSDLFTIITVWIILATYSLFKIIENRTLINEIS